MDSRDQLDRLLDDSAPTTLRIDQDVTRDLELMSTAAAKEAAAALGRTRRTPRLVIGFGLAVLLTAGSGAAVAAVGLGWAPWAEDPDFAYSFTLPSGRACEERLVLEQTEQTGDWNEFVGEVKALSIDDNDVDRIADALRANPQAIIQVVGDEGTFGKGVLATEATDDDLSAAAHHIALSDATRALSAAAGIDGWWNADEQLLCAVVRP